MAYPKRSLAVHGARHVRVAAADGRGCDILVRIWAPLSVQTSEGAAGSKVAAAARGVLGSLFCAVHATSLVGTVNVKPGVTFVA